MTSVFYFLTTFFIGIIAIYFLIKFSEKTNFLVDKPEGDELKIHKKAIPLVGGVAIAAAAGIFMPAAVFAALLPVFFLGFYDDLKWKHVSTIKPMLKFGLLLACTFMPAVILFFAGIYFNFFPVPTISIILGFIYIFVCINAVNYQDGMDGLAGGLCAISLVGFFLAGAGPLSLVAFGAVVAFLIFNLPPAKVFMGDSGAYLLGFILAVLAMLLSKPYHWPSLIGPIFIIGLPIFDGVYTNIRRLIAGKSILLGDRSHMYDKLLQKGFSTKKTLAICYGLQVVLIIVGIKMYSI